MAVAEASCGLDRLAEIVARAGYASLVVMSPPGRLCDRPSSGHVPTAFPVYLVARPAGLALLGHQEPDCKALGRKGEEPASGTTGPPVTVSTLFDGWGGVRLYRNRPQDGKFPLVSAWSMPAAQTAAFSDGFGVLSAHEVATDPEQPLVFVAHNAGGLRVLSHADGKLVEVGHAQGSYDLWGVEVSVRRAQRLVLASDRHRGLVIFRYRPRS
jgi:hypothetical protein